jgi:bleomycin hydrolase
MSLRPSVRPAAILLAAALASSCGSRATPPGPVAGQPKHDQAVYARETPTSAAPDFLAAELAGFERPTNLLEFTRLPHLAPVEQGKTGNCWCYAATSLLESELRRQGKAEVKLSEMFTVYWEYVEKARRFIREKGNSVLRAGSEPGLALERIKQYGLVRASDYTGLLNGRTAHDHEQLFSEFRSYLNALAAKNDWDESWPASGPSSTGTSAARPIGSPSRGGP